MTFLQTETEFGVQEFCEPCAKEQDVTTKLTPVSAAQPRCCDSCGAWRDGIGAGRRVFA